MLSRIHKHFGSVGVERTCCVADWQKNIGTRCVAERKKESGRNQTTPP